jgi:hypothetical protein
VPELGADILNSEPGAHFPIFVLTAFSSLRNQRLLHSRAA